CLRWRRASRTSRRRCFRCAASPGDDAAGAAPPSAMVQSAPRASAEGARHMAIKAVISPAWAVSTQAWRPRAARPHSIGIACRAGPWDGRSAGSPTSSGNPGPAC
ncbi:MAG: hypothetical protein AVDCRST_MAG27-4510, partial [uncultured Craurococcus sp.]